MSNLDQISVEMGKLLAESAEARRQREDLASEMRSIKDTLSVIPQLSRDIEDLKTPVQDYKRLKNKGIGVLVGVALASGALGTTIFKGIQSFLAGH